MSLIVSDGAGTSSHHAEYDAAPVDSTSCSVPVWINVESVALQPASMQPPPIPIQSDESSARRRATTVDSFEGPFLGDLWVKAANLPPVRPALTRISHLQYFRPYVHAHASASGVSVAGERAAYMSRPSAEYQRAYSTARDSRITVTLIWPGYSSSFSISRAIS